MSIFMNNTTSLNSSIAMAEGYDCSYGIAQALVESARNDFAMFKAMASIDAKEIQLKESGVLDESSLVSLQEAAISGIWKKIKELFAKLVAKIKAIVHSFMAKINGLFMKDKDLIKKYKDNIRSKIGKIDNLEVKWRKISSNATIPDIGTYSLKELGGYYNPDTEEIYKKFLGGKEKADYHKETIDEYFDDVDTVKISEIGGASKIITNFESFSNELNKFDKKNRDGIKSVENLVKQADDASKAELNKATEKDPNEAGIKSANETYDVAKVYQDCYLMVLAAGKEILTIGYKQYKAAFIKMAAVDKNSKKLEESAYLDALEEAAANEVEDVINSALSSEELSKICNASKAVKDADVSDDYNKLTYGQDCYSDNGSYVRTDGSIDSNIVGKHESFDFNAPIY